MTKTSVPMSEIIEKSRSMLCLRLYIVRSVPDGPLQDVLDTVPDHLAFQVDLERQGILFAAGPVWDEASGDWRGEGVVVLRAEDRDEAVCMAKLDPMHARGARRFTVEPWLINEGSMALKVTFSDQKTSII